MRTRISPRARWCRDLAVPTGISERGGDRRQVHPEEVVQDDDGAPLRPEPFERAVEQVAIGDERCHVGHRGVVERRQLHLHGTTPPAAGRVHAGMEDESMEPGLEAIRIAKGRQAPPGADEALLDRVSRELGVPEDEAGRGIQPRDARAGKHGEGVMIASPGPLDESSLVHGHPRVGAATSSRFGWYGARISPKVPGGRRRERWPAPTPAHRASSSRPRWPVHGSASCGPPAREIVTRIATDGTWADARLAEPVANLAAYSPTIALQGMSGVAISWAERTGTPNYAALRYAESTNDGEAWYGAQTIASTAVSTRRSNDFPSIVWPSAGTRYVSWNGWTSGGDHHRIYLRKGTGTPSGLAEAAPIATLGGGEPDPARAARTADRH